MDNPMVLFGPLLSIVAVGAMLGFGYFARRKAMADGHKNYANYRLFDIAQRTGMNIVEGDPNANLMMAAAEFQQQRPQGGSMLGSLTGEGTKSMQMFLRGIVWGRPYSFAYAMRHDVEQGLAEVRHIHWFDCHLAAGVQANVPEFEITLRQPQDYLAAERQTALPPSQFGIPAIDQVLTIAASDPRVGPALANAMVPLMNQGFVHLVGRGNEVRAVTTRYGCYVLFQGIEVFQRALEQIACVFEGRA